ncbi:DUF6716 putative glycosyltransferase [Granulicoccus phenolivorans]|uniref:DUF6716 putative glycosyltransferase n=1 Tax=Granulicoccus phenolivorans TaxID=266854 RepID=UPI00040B5F35|nr:DUF6716 putative glycosyltransferase [Granulicoccus phenolivorans]
MNGPVRVVAISDADSYLKWAYALLRGAPAHWRVEHVVLANPIAPSAAQIAAATGLPAAGEAAVGASAPGGGAAVTRDWAPALIARLRRQRPDVLLVACTGPALDAVLTLGTAAGLFGAGRPVLVTGLPGISWPANDLAVEFRAPFDLMVLHSRREVAAYDWVAQQLGARVRPVLARLPFLPTGRAEGGTEVVFAAQSLVPARPTERTRILAALSRVPAPLQPVVKVRALAGERQAHNEAAPYADLYAELRREQPDTGAVEFRAGSMAAALERAHGFATVSSTAVLEAIALGVPSLVLDEFGVNRELINLVFADSGLLGGLDRLASGNFAHPDPAWLDANYFHPPQADTWIPRIEELIADRRAGRLGALDRVATVGRAGTGSVLARARRLLRVVPPPALWRR